MAVKIVLFELNEVPWRIIDDFVREHPRSCLSRLLPRMRQFDTCAEDSSLSPWITWPTLHRGVSDETHTISDFGQDLSGVNRAYPPLWDILVRQGIPTGVCGSLHTYPLPPNVSNYRFYIPDVFAAGAESFPPRTESFQAFSLQMSRASARNVAPGLPWDAAMRFLMAGPALGLKSRTLLDLGWHLLKERRHKLSRVRRRTYQVVLAFDIFMRQLEQTKPAFSTFFTNHVASAMHRYWAARYPEDYSVFGYTDEWVATYRDEIMWTMSKFDAMLGRLARFVTRSRDCVLWIASSMGQAATEAREAQTQLYLDEVEVFMRRLGFARGDWEQRPAMLPRVVLSVRTDRADELERKLDTIRIADRGPLPWKRLERGVVRIHPGVLQNVHLDAGFIGEERVPLTELGFRSIEIEDGAGQSAYHIPQGALLVYDPRSASIRRGKTSISTLDVAPMILDHFGITPPNYMRRLRA